MTVDAPDWDDNLSGHSAVALGAEHQPIVHAVITAYKTQDVESATNETECGKPVQDEEIRPRMSFDETENKMCPDCWPETIDNQ